MVPFRHDPGKTDLGLQQWFAPGQPLESPPPELDFNVWLAPAPEQSYHANLVPYNWHWFWDTDYGDTRFCCSKCAAWWKTRIGETYRETSPTSSTPAKEANGMLTRP